MYIMVVIHYVYIYSVYCFEKLNPIYYENVNQEHYICTLNIVLLKKNKYFLIVGLLR